MCLTDRLSAIGRISQTSWAGCVPHFLKQVGGGGVRSIILAKIPLCRHMTGSSSSTDQEGLIQPTNLSASFVLLFFSALRSVVEYWRGQARESNSYAGQARWGKRVEEKTRGVLRENEQPAVEELVCRRRMGGSESVRQGWVMKAWKFRV